MTKTNKQTNGDLICIKSGRKFSFLEIGAQVLRLLVTLKTGDIK